MILGLSKQVIADVLHWLLYGFSMYKKSIILILLIILVVISCNTGKNFPRELIGNWKIDIEATKADAIKRNMLEEFNYYMDKDSTMKITAEGEFIMDNIPTDIVSLQMTVMHKRKSNYIIKTINPLEPDKAVFADYRIVNKDKLCITILDENLAPIEGVLNGFYKKQK